MKHLHHLLAFLLLFFAPILLFAGKYHKVLFIFDWMRNGGLFLTTLTLGFFALKYAKGTRSSTMIWVFALIGICYAAAVIHFLNTEEIFYRHGNWHVAMLTLNLMAVAVDVGLHFYLKRRRQSP